MKTRPKCEICGSTNEAGIRNVMSSTAVTCEGCFLTWYEYGLTEGEAILEERKREGTFYPLDQAAGGDE